MRQNLTVKEERLAPAILLVEDEATDVELTREALRQANVSVDIHVVSDGEEAMEFLRRTGRHAGAPRVSLVLLDLNLPRKDGRMVLADVRADPALRRLVMLVLTSSESPRDVRDAYELGANAYVAKSMDFHRFTQSLRVLFEFWLGVAIPPKR